MKPYRRPLTNLVLTAIVAIAASWANHGHADAPPGRYMISNGTVFDTKTLLTWQQTISSSSYAWSSAQSYCTNLNLNGTGWRVPSMKELQTIIDETRTNPAIDTTAFLTTPNSNFWTSSPFAGSPSNAWGVAFNGGYTGYSAVANTYRVRCVR